MMEGYLTGLYVCKYFQKNHPDQEKLIAKYEHELDMLRNGPFGIKTKNWSREVKKR